MHVALSDLCRMFGLRRSMSLAVRFVIDGSRYLVVLTAKSSSELSRPAP